VPLEPEWRKRLKRRFDSDPEGRRGGSADPLSPRRPDGDERDGEADLFTSYTPVREPADTGPLPAALSPPEPLPVPKPPPAPPPAPAAPRRRGRTFLLVTLTVLVALAAGSAGGAAFERRREAAAAELTPDVQVITRPVPQVPPPCQAALDKAKEALGLAAALQRALADHTAVMGQLQRGQLSGDQAMRVGMPSLIRGAQVSAQLNDATKQYLNLSRQCGP
jgi:hypothetical protein